MQKSDRQRHHDGARPMHPVHRAARGRGGGHGAHASLGRALPARARRFAPGAVRHRAGRAVITICGKQSAAFLRELPFDGLAIGGLAVGETHAERYELTGLVTEHLPATSAALPDGRGHADRSAGGRAPRRRYVRLHHPFAARAARRGLHVAGQTPAPPLRVQILRRAGRCPVRLPGVPATTRAPTCTISSRPTRSSAGICWRFTT